MVMEMVIPPPDLPESLRARRPSWKGLREGAITHTTTALQYSRAQPGWPTDAARASARFREPEARLAARRRSHDTVA